VAAEPGSLPTATEMLGIRAAWKALS